MEQELKSKRDYAQFKELINAFLSQEVGVFMEPTETQHLITTSNHRPETLETRGHVPREQLIYISVNRVEKGHNHAPR